MLAAAVLVILLSYFIARIYTRPVERLMRNLDDESIITDLFYKTRMLPAEIRRLLRRILKFSDDLKAERDSFLADKAIFTSILRNMNDGILVVDQNGVVTLINQAACRIFDITQEDAAGAIFG